MLHAYVQKFDITSTAQNFFGTKRSLTGLFFPGEKTLTGLLCFSNGVQSVVASSVRPMFSRPDLLFYQIMQSEHLHNSSTIVNLVGGTLMTDEDQICTGQVR